MIEIFVNDTLFFRPDRFALRACSRFCRDCGGHYSIMLLPAALTVHNRLRSFINISMNNERMLSQ